MMDKRFQPLHPTSRSDTAGVMGAGCLMIALAALAVAGGVALLRWLFN